MKIALVTAYNNNFEEVGSLSSENKILYCSKQGYDFVRSDCIPDERFAFNWVKPLAINKLMDNYDYIMWSDADSIITNMTIRIEDFIGESPDSLIIAGRYIMDMKNQVDTRTYMLSEYPPAVHHLGNFIVKCSQESKYIMNRIYQLRDTGIDSIGNKLYEEHALYILLKNDAGIRDKVHTVSLKRLLTLNPGEYSEKMNLPIHTTGDYIAHFISTPNDKRVSLIHEYNKRIVW